MKIINYTIPSNNNIPVYYQHFHANGKLLFFDIETTGFLAKHTTLYLIGALWYENDTIYIRQWLNDTGADEASVLSSFVAFCKEYTHLIHYNGNGFDLPYLTNKGQLLNIDVNPILNLHQIDIYKIIRPYKNIFHLDHMKQINIEEFLGIKREDTYNGGELISVYQKYIASQDANLEQLLLLHNHDDLLGMPALSEILRYHAFFQHISIENFSYKREKESLNLNIQTSTECHLPKRISIFKNGFYLNAIDDKVILQIPIVTDTLKYFYSDYKNYYYLPIEDYAIHKSVASYVSSSNRKKATKETCYIKRQDEYIPCYLPKYPEQFAYNYKDKERYQLLSSFVDISKEDFLLYVQAILQQIIISK